MNHALELRYDGPIPGFDPADRPPVAAQLFERLLDECMRGKAKRRGTHPPGDDLLETLTQDLAAYRAYLVAAHTRLRPSFLPR